jgi:hypothetical protein
VTTGVKPRIVVAGALAQKPRQAGHTWVFLQYMLGLRRLGWDPIFVDRILDAQITDEHGAPTTLASSVNLSYVREALARFGLDESYTLLSEDGRATFGRAREELIEDVRGAAALINFNGFLDDEEILAAAPMRVFFDIDPGIWHVWQEMGIYTAFTGHDRYVTLALNIGRPDCDIPTCGIDWITTCHPVVLEEWPRITAPHAGKFTSIGAWRGPFGVVEHNGKVFGPRVHEFRKFMELPVRSPERFQIALDIHPAEVTDLERLGANRWELVDPAEVGRSITSYREYIQSSKGEFLVCQGRVSNTNSGWISDRSICYLASGRPVVMQDTGLATAIPTGRGLVTYSTLDGAVAAVADVSEDYPRHADAARGLAEEYFDSDIVLRTLLAKLGIA